MCLAHVESDGMETAAWHLRIDVAGDGDGRLAPSD